MASIIEVDSIKFYTAIRSHRTRIVAYYVRCVLSGAGGYLQLQSLYHHAHCTTMVLTHMRHARAALQRHTRISRPYGVAHPNRTCIFSHQCNHEQLRCSPTRAFSSQPQASTAAVDAETIHLLAQSLADQQATQALTHFTSLKTPPSQLLSQKLAILLAKRGNLQQTERAVDILKAVYLCVSTRPRSLQRQHKQPTDSLAFMLCRQPSLKPDDYTTLASIHVVDACLRHHLLDQALEVSCCSRGAP